ncbi:MAG: helix-turn-helix transcriptional regulator, partial [Candidatus Rokubacteria bacterium]|nr:helix-turn-helix transcriptional regulator [Candidatus Rokubacteria bacterium]
MEAAERLGVSQPYLAMLERGQRPMTPKLVQRAAKVYGLAPTAVPRSPRALPARLNAATLARDLAGFG